MGTFDILNMRINGYQYHVDLIAGQEVWTPTEVKAVFAAWDETCSRTTRRTRTGGPGRRLRRR